MADSRRNGGFNDFVRIERLRFARRYRTALRGPGGPNSTFAQESVFSVAGVWQCSWREPAPFSARCAESHHVTDGRTLPDAALGVHNAKGGKCRSRSVL
jgi:hypothetical protein